MAILCRIALTHQLLATLHDDYLGRHERGNSWLPTFCLQYTSVFLRISSTDERETTHTSVLGLLGR